MIDGRVLKFTHPKLPLWTKSTVQRPLSPVTPTTLRTRFLLIAPPRASILLRCISVHQSPFLGLLANLSIPRNLEIGADSSDLVWFVADQEIPATVRVHDILVFVVGNDPDSEGGHERVRRESLTMARLPQQGVEGATAMLEVRAYWARDTDGSRLVRRPTENRTCKADTDDHKKGDESAEHGGSLHV